MKSFIWLLGFLLISVPVFAETDTTVVIESGAVLVCEGKELTSPFEVVLSGDRVTVNGHEVTSLERLKIAEEVSLPKPAPETPAYIHWLVNEVNLEAKARLAAKQSRETVWQYMNDFLAEQTKASQKVLLSVEGKTLRLRHASWPEGLDVIVPVPEVLPAPVDPSQLLADFFNQLCLDLQADHRVTVKLGSVKVTSLGNPAGQ